MVTIVRIGFRCRSDWAHLVVWFALTVSACKPESTDLFSQTGDEALEPSGPAEPLPPDPLTTDDPDAAEGSPPNQPSEAMSSPTAFDMAAGEAGSNNDPAMMNGEEGDEEGAPPNPEQTSPPPVSDPPLDEPPLEPPPIPPGSEQNDATQPRICPPIVDPVLVDFVDPGSSPSQAVFGDFRSSISGGTFVFPDRSAAGSNAGALAPGLISNVTAGDWHISGLLAEPGGFGLFFDCHLIDASRFAGISFSLQGEVELGGAVTLFIHTASNDVSPVWRLEVEGAEVAGQSFGRCIPDQNAFDGSCRQPRISIPVSRDGLDVFVPFSALAGGSPEEGVNPSEITNISWTLPVPTRNAEGGAVPFAVDLRFDDLRFAEFP